MQDPVEERKKYGGCAFSAMRKFANMGNDALDHNHTHGHNHDHDHNHNHNHDAPTKSSCGYMPVEEIKKLKLNVYHILFFLFLH